MYDLQDLTSNNNLDYSESSPSSSTLITSENADQSSIDLDEI